MIMPGMIKKGLVYGLVLARGGSKGLPGKNLRPLAGFPLVCWAVAAGLAASLPRVICSTDDLEIKKAAVWAGAEAPFDRPTEWAGDAATDLDVFRHLLSWLAEHERKLPEFIVQLRPTTPFRDPQWIQQGLRLIESDAETTSVRSVTPTPITPYKMWRERPGQNTIEPVITVPGMSEAYNLPRAELPPVLWHTGQVDIIRTKTVLSESMTGDRIVGLHVPQELAVDIDTLIDFQLAELRAEEFMPIALTRYLESRR